MNKRPGPSEGQRGFDEELELNYITDDDATTAAPTTAAGADRPAAAPTPVRTTDSERGGVTPTTRPTPSSSSTKREPEPHLDETLDTPVRSGLSGATWVALIAGAIVLILLLIFILQNNVPATFNYFNLTFTLPLGVAMLFAAIGGMLIMGLFGSIRLFQLGHRVRKLEKERESIKRTLK